MIARRPTKQRAALADALADTDEFVSAQDLHARIAAGGSNVGLATVYRNLQAMAAEGAIDVLRTDDGEALYRACGTAEHHHHLVCRDCGREQEILVRGSEEPHCSSCDSPKLSKLLSVPVARSNGSDSAPAGRPSGGSCGGGCACHPH